MVKYLMVIIFTVSAATVQAKIDEEALAAGIIGFILGKIHDKNQHKKPDQGFVWDQEENVILKDIGRKIILGTVVLVPRGGTDAVRFPSCDFPGARNKRVNALRFRVDRADAYVRSVQITYNNGERETVRVNDGFGSQQSSDWFYVSGGNRCIRQIAVTGEALGGTGFSSKGRYSALTFTGAKSNGF